MLLTVKKWLIVRLPLVWKLWMVHLYFKFRQSSFEVSWNQTNVDWDYWNKKYHPNLRFTPLEVYSCKINDPDEDLSPTIPK